jgi:hypothetical protein
MTQTWQTTTLESVKVGDMVWFRGNAWRVNSVNFINVMGQNPVVLQLAGGRPLTGKREDVVEIFR